MTDPDWAALDAAWRPARKAGVLGGATTEDLIAHAAGYLPAACRVDEEFSGIDLGTGAGVPGVILAALRPASSWVLVDGNARRCEFAQTAVRALGLGDRVAVRHARAEEIAHDSTTRHSADLVVARSFGAPAELAECALPLVAPSGRLVVSVSAETLEAWQSANARLPVRLETTTRPGEGRYLSIRLEGDPDPAWPRRSAVRHRSPLF